ncbi:MAG: rhomboid family intramembrane serine protease [Bacteroidetes bacterium]|nr:rhomboid family intramembrane serine protease [Bacteroidota bacterium]
MSDNEAAFHRKRLLLSMAIPVAFMLLAWLVFFTSVLMDFSTTLMGIYPHSLKGLPGILLSPFSHSDFTHLLNNTFPVLILGTALFYFYGEVAFKVFLINWVLTGFLVWLGGREAWHVGASGVVYGLAFFIFFSGIIRRYFRLMALTLLVVFLYGSMVWGMFPFVPVNISWESHMLGAASGIFLAVRYRHEGPQPPVYEWMEEEEESELK